MRLETLMRFSFRLLLLVTLCNPLAAGPARGELPFRSGERILFIGDSITQAGQYAALIEAYLWASRPELELDIVNAGLSSETVSGITEPIHPFPRPNVHSRLGRALELARPDWVFVCYGMNDGIYHPASPEIIDKYRDGLRQVIERVRAGGAKLILLTPPSFDFKAPPIQNRLKNVAKDEPFGYLNPHPDYDQTLVALGDVVKSFAKEEGVQQVIDLHATTDAYLKRVKAAKPDYTYGDGVHPPADGHLAMAIGILEGLGQSPAEAEKILTQLTGLAPADKTVAPTGPQGAMASKLLDRFNQRSAAYRKAIGVPAPMTANAPPLDEADRAAADARVELRRLIAAAYQPPAVSQTRIDQANKKWAEEIAKLEARDKSESYPDDAILFIGSSSIRMWKGLDENIAPYRGINRGYGGARYRDLAVFAQRLITPHKYAAAVVFVANDIVGKPADTPLDELDRLVRHIVDVSKKHQPDAPVLIVEITPTESRFAAYPQIRKANFVLREIALTEPGVFLVETNDYYLTPDRKPIADYFLDDRLHQNPTGYELWGSLIKRELDEVLASRQSGRMRPVEDLAPATP